MSISLQEPMGNQSHKAKQFLLLLLKILVVLAAVLFIVFKLTSSEELHFGEFVATLDQYRVFSLLNISVLLLLSFLNWLFEVKKWQILSSSIRRNTTKRATKESLASFTAAIFTPSRIGEYGAKSLYYLKPARKKVIFLNFVGNTSQLFVTFFFGIVGLLYLLSQMDLPFNALNGLLMAALLVAPFLLYWVMRHFKWKIKGYSVEKLEQSFQKISRKVRMRTLLYATLRYLIFTHQFYFFLMIFNVDLPYLLVISAVFTTYFLSSIIPTMMIFDALIKGGFAVWIFGLLKVPELIVLVIVLAAWILNFGLPALVGSYFVLKYKPQMKHPA